MHDYSARRVVLGDPDATGGTGFFRRSEGPADWAALAAAPRSRPAEREVAFINGLNPDGTINANSFAGQNGETAFKWGEPTTGTGATISYAFRNASAFTEQEKATMIKAMAMWSSVADVTFVAASKASSAQFMFQRGNDGGAYTITPTSNGTGSTPGSVTGVARISIDTSVQGFDLSGSFDTVGGYGLSTVIHELGHLLGLGHGGPYNGDVNPRRDQNSAYDDRMYTIMSYISWTDTNARYAPQNPVHGTNWGIADDGIYRQAPHSVMSLDIQAIQQLYGVPQTTPLDGGETYGFHTTLTGALAGFFDFTVNTHPVVTLYNRGIGNTLDLSGYTMGETVDLHPGAFSSVGGLSNNLCIATGTQIETAICGGGNDVLRANDTHGALFAGDGADALYGGKGADDLHGEAGVDVLTGGGGQDVLSGGAGGDIFVFAAIGDSARARTTADLISDFSHADGDRIDLSAIDAITGGTDDAFTFIGTAAFGNVAGELRVQAFHGDLLLSGDVNGDGRADFTIRLEHVASLQVSDFTL